MIEEIELKYSVGALLYTPALNDKIATSVVNEKFGQKYSLALCLEDTISDKSVEIAEKQLVQTINDIHKAKKMKQFYCPKIFIRVRTPEQMKRIFYVLKEVQETIFGFIIPKYSVNNATEYNSVLTEINKNATHKIYMMPILESQDIINLTTRLEVLNEIKAQIDSVKEYILNVRVGGNDFSNQFSTRRYYDETIYDILPISQLLGDILTVFSREYVVSGPVWEFFSSDKNEWKEGLEHEIKLDKLNGFIGKTVIHPKQIQVVNDALKVSKKDYEDSKKIINWDEAGLQVGKSFGGERMNETKTHYNWAIKTLTLAKIYGIKEN